MLAFVQHKELGARKFAAAAAATVRTPQSGQDVGQGVGKSGRILVVSHLTFLPIGQRRKSFLGRLITLAAR